MTRHDTTRNDVVALFYLLQSSSSWKREDDERKQLSKRSLPPLPSTPSAPPPPPRYGPLSILFNSLRRQSYKEYIFRRSLNLSWKVVLLSPYKVLGFLFDKRTSGMKKEEVHSNVKGDPKQGTGTAEDAIHGHTSPPKDETPRHLSPLGEVNMEATITSEDLIRAGGFGARDDISSFLPVASDATDFEETLRDAREYEEPQPEGQFRRPGLGWTDAAGSQ